MAEKRYKVHLNSCEKLEELLQEIYDQSCRHIQEIQNEVNRLATSTNMADENFTMDDKAKYSKAMHDYLNDKRKAMDQKLEIAKLMNEVIKHNGDAKSAVEDKNFVKKTSLNLSEIRAAMQETETKGSDVRTYNVK